MLMYVHAIFLSIPIDFVVFVETDDESSTSRIRGQVTSRCHFACQHCQLQSSYIDEQQTASGAISKLYQRELQ